MRTALIALATTLALTGAALAQTGAPGSAENNLNNPASVKSNAEKGMPERDLTTGTVAPTAPGTMAPAARADDLPSHSGGNAAATSPANRAR
ncbi:MULTISPECIES: hypothetical protein [Methylobacterium]|jgi:hypothetical protein|uniref:hypothetical protein n=1 Tax=Methylobacterium TaxID=407 RepID=UPI0008E8B140|nr:MULTISPECIES: hypothetical protein [Methylobacterium]MBK3395086.1 hypothetical protein [Methylobacterium ajmalii]MBK3410167.1 hypothetical protein [Methylobacterium ajmalii]MBK3425761.1 hypothetical protein [Methylobacterium ajmalii]MBZ6415419.1 hypothetical protein [Methylobacterium sp.]SFF30403.1 hypothetical protein SAMN04487844_11430 [Methylobacterium sp. yr596]